MLLSKACIYGLRASLFLASTERSSFISISRISEQLDISRHFLTKILQELTQSGLLESLKGPNGGVRFVKPASEIRLIDVVEAIDGLDLLNECVLGLPGCGNEKPCPVHEEWSETRGELRQMLEENTLTEIAGKGKQFNLRITEKGDFNWMEET
ncbi:MAG: Rrf2 family transcriptional regulator [Balneolaceae bacterium]|nr:Rrf2 family transcriptional regulator [Balneolaceae bacterium]